MLQYPHGACHEDKGEACTDDITDENRCVGRGRIDDLTPLRGGSHVAITRKSESRVRDRYGMSCDGVGEVEEAESQPRCT